MAQVTFSFSTTSRDVLVTAGASAGSLAGGHIVESIDWNGSTTKGQLFLVKESLTGATLIRQKCDSSYGNYSTYWGVPRRISGIWVSMPGGTAIIRRT